MKNLETIQKISISVLDSPILHLLLVLLPAVLLIAVPFAGRIAVPSMQKNPPIQKNPPKTPLVQIIQRMNKSNSF